MRFLRSADYPQLAWKNGLGVSRIVASHPEGAGYDRLLWQVSTTQIAANCPFSSLPGLDRHFIVLEGRGVELHCRWPEGELRARVQPGSGPFEFKGDWQTGCRLLAGPVEVFNVMARRGRWSARVSMSPDAAIKIPEQAAGDTLLAFVLDAPPAGNVIVRLSEIRAAAGQ